MEVQRGGEGEIKRTEHTLLSIPVMPQVESDHTHHIKSNNRDHIHSEQLPVPIHLLYCWSRQSTGLVVSSEGGVCLLAGFFACLFCAGNRGRSL